MMRYVYVLSIEDRDKMIERGYKLIHSQEPNINGKRGEIYVFENKPIETFSIEDIGCIYSNALLL